MRHEAIPTFYLYGEPHRSAAAGFVHVESLDERSRPTGWTIRAHAHADLAHIFFIARGGGAMRAEDRAITFAAPCLLIVPAATAHGFTWHHESRGSVVTLASDCLADIVRRDGDIAPLFRRARAIPLDDADAAIVRDRAAALMREFGWAAPGHRTAVESALLAIVAVGRRRIAAVDGGDAPRPGHHVALVARLRERIEQRFRRRESIDAHAAALGVSATALRAACARVAAMPPAAMLDQRTILEARRALLYSNLSVAEIAYAVGFADPAYFSRFFARHVGRSPRAYRAGAGRGPSVGLG